MIWKRIRSYLVYLFLCVFIAALFLSAWSVSNNAPDWLRTVGIEIRAACRDAGTQWMVAVCLLSYLIVFVVLEAKSRVLGLGSKVGEQEAGRPTSNAQRPTSKETDVRHLTPALSPNEAERVFPPSSILHPPSASRPRATSYLLNAISSPDFWLVTFVALVLLRYAVDYSNAAKSLQVVVLLTGMVVGKGIALYANRRGARGEGREERATAECGVQSAESPSFILHLPSSPRRLTILTILTLLLACAALWHPERGMEFQYRGQPRWTGPWDNPNLFGVLMGTGLTLALGLLGSRVLGLGSGGKRPTSNFQRPTSKVRRLTSLVTRHATLPLLLGVAGLCGIGLVKSYSRGAWLGTAVGLAWLIGSWVWRLGSGGGHPKSAIGNQKSEMASFRRCWFPSSIFILSILVIAFWQFRHTESPLARRVFSVGNPNDFSWRNRVAAWEGAGRMMLARPIIGFGWGKAEEVYSKEYRAARLEESAAIQMNDYLMIGISAGTPALACLLGYLFLTGFQVSGFKFQARQAETLDLGLKPLDSMPTICFAGAIVGMVGFWFDGGLFKLPTCVVFWVLVELARGSRRGAEAVAALASDEQNGRAALLRRPAEQQLGPTELQGASVHASWLVGSLAPPIQCGAQRTARPTIALRWLAAITALVALGLTTLHLGTPQFAVSERTLSVARKFLVPPGERNDFEFLAAKNIWSNTPLKTLLQHAHLANYNRTLVNWKLDEPMYREFVLSPEIADANSLSAPRLGGARESEPSTVHAQPSTHSAWRRPLWEHFYPRIRKESNSEAAAEIVVRHLNEVCWRRDDETNHPLTRPPATLSPSDGARGTTPDVVAYNSILEIWRQQEANEAEFARVCVAAWRAVGIPARLAASGSAEFWSGTEWREISRPLAAGKATR